MNEWLDFMVWVVALLIAVAKAFTVGKVVGQRDVLTSLGIGSEWNLGTKPSTPGKYRTLHTNAVTGRVSVTNNEWKPEGKWKYSNRHNRLVGWKVIGCNL